MAQGFIRIRGAREHNLRGVDVDIPRERLVVVTGVSGSGKSSLAFDTLYAEGQRKYLASMSAYARQFLDQLKKPDVESIEGLPPTIAVEQRSLASSPRSTVATVAEIYDHLRLLYARAGTVLCWHPLETDEEGRVRKRCGRAIEATHPAALAEQLLALPEGSRFLLLAPVVRAEPGWHAEWLPRLKREGFVRARVDGKVLELAELDETSANPFKLRKEKAHTLEVVVDRLSVRPGMRQRLMDSLETALRQGSGTVSVSLQNAQGEAEEQTYSEHLACALHPEIRLPSLEPSLFSFNSPAGACPTCQGLGRRRDEDGIEGEICPDCGGTRLKIEALSVVLRSRAKRPEAPASFRAERGLDWPKERLHIAEWAHLDVQRAQAVLEALELDEGQRDIVEVLRRELQHRLHHLESMGLGYLALDRPTSTLSGGEAQRVRLAAQIGLGLVGTAYVLDEPTMGLHPRDSERLVQVLRRLVDLGNTVVLVEHDEEVMRAADHLIDVGPGPGARGGNIVAQGSVAEVAANEASLTGDYLSGRKGIELPKTRRSPQPRKRLRLEGVSHHNLRKLDVDFPLGCFIGVSGVSGSGKSSLVEDVLLKGLQRALARKKPLPLYKNLRGDETILRVIAIDQSPIGRSPRSTPSTYVGLFDEVRNLLSQTPEARTRGFSASRFSFNVKGGRCEACQGQGQRRVEMSFLPDLYVECAVCQGQRYHADALDIRYRGKHVADILAMSFAEAESFFEAFPRIRSMARCLVDVGLGYLTLGQSSVTLSGGEAQRIKLAAELGRPTASFGSTFYILDEPTTGLHLEDVKRLLGVLEALVDRGDTVLVVEHHLEVLKRVDWLIDLGPEAGDEGGRILGAGPPEEIAAIEASFTGKFLAPLLARRSARKAHSSSRGK